jgi:hypothetical protein
MTRPPFPEVIDNSIRSAFVSCPRKCYLEYLQHYKPRNQSVHLHAGGAYAHGLEAARVAYYEQGHPAEYAIAVGLAALIQFYGNFECPPESAKSCERMAGALEYYFSQYPLESDPAVPSRISEERHGIEFSFAEPLLDILHPETGNPLIYCGRMDMVADFAGARYGEDDKTTSSLGASWSKQWDLRAQFTGYCWGAAQGGIPLEGFLVRGVSILKTKYDTQQAVTYRPQWMIDRWYEQLHRDLRRMITAWEEGYWDYNLDESCNAFGGCLFKKVCLSDKPDLWLSTDYERRRWDPVNRTEVVVEETKHLEGSLSC